MVKNKQNLNDFSANVASQFGEDGIIEEIFSRLASTTPIDKWCVEFGAWDGIHLSNTYNLIKNKGYKAVLIEADKAKHKQLVENFSSESILKLRKFVSFEGENQLDNILKNTLIPHNFDFLSIDIDGCDYYILQSLTQYRPKVICIEYNPSIPNDIEFIQLKNFALKQGSSAKSLLTLGIEKGYSLAAVTYCNLILIRNDLKEYVIGKNEYSLNDLRDDSEVKMCIFVGYDGSILSNKPSLHLTWHGLTVNLADIQFFPRYLRTFSSDYSFFQKVFLFFWLLLKKPISLQEILKKRWSKYI